MPATRLLPVKLCLTLCLACISCTGTPREIPSPLAARSSAEIQLGITVQGIHLTSGGYMLDFRYRVDDPQKAGPMIDHNIIPYIVHDESGASFMIPAPGKTGPLRQMPRGVEAGRTYFMFFANPGQYVKPGDHVTVVIGDYRFSGLKVL